MLTIQYIHLFTSIVSIHARLLQLQSIMHH